uniref:Carbamoyl-phosphate synthase large subunit (CarB, CPA2) n=1 Tax=uncultured marine group II/III euryarchaeote KM3_176_D09 TaxID=1457935 RepID=A0A075GSJ6_9EURY|nr:carbamoyl-phosphate synthase large subunit (carB, CPA2) [uncultured marine group II/III euryarchaeote KM3_176_D09]
MKVLVTGIGGNIGMDLARSLRQAEHAVVGTDMDPRNLLIGQQVADAVHPAPPARSPGYYDALNAIIADEGVTLVLCNPDGELELVSPQRDRLVAPLFALPERLVATFLDKGRTVEFLDGLAATPRTLAVRGAADLARAFEKLEPPLWLRATAGAGGRGSILVRELDEATAWLHYWREHRWEWLAQEYLPGRNFNWTGILWEGELVTSGSSERLDYLMAAAAVSGITGNIRTGRTLHDERLNVIGAAICERLDGSGTVSVDLREDRDGNPLVTEINARFAARPWLYTGAGANFAAAIIELAEGRRPQMPKFDAPQAGMLEIRQVDAEPVIIPEAELDNYRFSTES